MNVHFRINSRALVVGVTILACSCGGDGAAPPSQPPKDLSPSLLVALTDTVLQASVEASVLPAPSVRVLDAAHTPVRNAVVTFAADNGASVMEAAGRTDANGVATVGAWTIGTRATIYSLVANVTGAKPLTFSVKARSGAVAAISLVSGDRQSDTVRALLAQPISARAADKFGNPVAGVTVTFTPDSASGTVTPASAVTDSDGMASVRWTIGKMAGSMNVRATAPAVQGTVTFTATADWPMIRSVALASGYYHNCAVLTSGPVVCWGWNANGQLGDGTRTSRFIAVRVATSLVFDRVAAGHRHSCALTPDGQAYCWGDNFWGELGVGDEVSRMSPTAVYGGLRFRMLTAGVGVTCGLTTSGEVYCWGAISGPLWFLPNVPVRVSGNYRFASITGNTFDMCGMGTDGLAYCFTSPAPYGVGIIQWGATPVATSVPLTAVTNGESFTCGLAKSGAAYCWGQNVDGVLGDPAAGSTFPAVPIDGGRQFVELHSGAGWTCGVAADRQRWCWGRNLNGAFGFNGPPFVYQTPVTMKLPAALDFVTWTSGGTHSCAIGLDKLTYCWGGNNYGQLGDGGVASSATPLVARRQ